MKHHIPLLYWVAILLAIIMMGTIGFILIENFSFLDALYMTIITVTTIGYGEVQPLTSSGKIFNMFLIFSSFSIFTYSLATLTQFIASGDMALYFKNRKLMHAIDKLNNHVIICGFGRNGQQAALTLKTHNVPFIVIEKTIQHINQWAQNDSSLIYLHADATDDEVLVKAGIQKARALIITLPVDADNVFIVLSARSLNENIKIISRASEHGSTQKLKKAGADSVIMPDVIGGNHMANLVSKPDIIEFLSYLSSENGGSACFESIDYETLPAEMRNKTLRTIMEWKTGSNCISIKTVDGKFIISPSGETIVSKGMKLILLRSAEQIKAARYNKEEG